MNDSNTIDDLAGQTIGDRIRHFRNRAGMSRPVLGGLCGKSSEWVKAVETGRLHAPRLPMLLRIAEVLNVEDLAALTGDERLSAASYTKASHEQLNTVAEVLTRYPLGGNGRAAAQPAHLARRVRQAWDLWHGSARQRTAVATVLPDLLEDAQLAARELDDQARRAALGTLAQTYHLAQLYLSFQPVPDLVNLCGDRAMMAAQDADDPHAMAVAAWYLNHVYRDAGHRHEARVDLALRAVELLTPEQGPEDLARWGLLHLAAALSYAKVGQEGPAWHHWDRADQAARALGERYAHPWLIFGRGMVDAYAVTMLADLMRGGEAVKQGGRLRLEEMPSATRRSFHYIETARAHNLRREPVGAVYMLRKAHDVSPDTIRYNLWTRSALVEFAARGPNTVQGDVHELANRIGVTL